MTFIPPRKLEAMTNACAESVTQALWSCLAHNRPADRALSAYLRANRQLGSRDRRLISETFFGLLRWWGWLNRLAPQSFRRAVSQAGPHRNDAPAIRPEAWAKAFLAAHLLDSNGLPPAAVIWRRQAAIHDRDLQQIPEQKTPNLWNRRLDPFFREGARPAFRHKELIPEWAAREIPEKCSIEQLIQWLQKRPPVWLRAQQTPTNRLRILLQEEGIRVHPQGKLDSAVAIDPPHVNLRTIKPFKEGWFEVQDAASQCVARICSPQPGQRWWDACAGAGGKTLHIATLMNSKGTVVASDIRTHKFDDLRRRARRAGLSNIRTKEWKGKALPKKMTGYDGVLVDAPCSCSGTWRRNPDARWTTQRADVIELAELQLSLLTNAATAVRKDGTLVYATCSMFTRENDHVVQTFLRENQQFQLDPFKNPLDGTLTDGTLQIWPWDSDCDAMFVARMKRMH